MGCANPEGATGGNIGRQTTMSPVDCRVDSRQNCPSCEDRHEQNCTNGPTTYNGRVRNIGKTTLGSHAQCVVMREKIVLCVPAT